MFIVNGGKGANQAVAAARLQAKACFAGQMGKDDNAQLLIKGNLNNNYSQYTILLNFYIDLK